MSTCVSMQVHVCGQRTALGIALQVTAILVGVVVWVYLVVCDRVLHLAWSFPSGLGEPLGSSCLCLPKLGLQVHSHYA